MKRSVKGTILRNRPVFTGIDDVGDRVTGRVSFSRPLRMPPARRTHFHVSVELDDGRVATGYWTPGKPVNLMAGWRQ